MWGGAGSRGDHHQRGRTDSRGGPPAPSSVDILLHLEKLSWDVTLSRLLPLQTTKNDEVITTEVIEEFRMGPDETKTVQ